MQRIARFFRINVLIVLAAAVTACSVIKKPGSSGGADYKSSKTVPSLEVPPDLTSDSIDRSSPIPGKGKAATYSDYSSRNSGKQGALSSGVLPEQESLRVEREGNRQWLVVQGSPDQVWPVLQKFWPENGLVIALDEPRIGIMETDWAENRSDIPKGRIRSVISKAFKSAYSAATRDKFRIRLEKGQEEGFTELYLTHRGMEEVVQGAADEVTSAVWRPRPSDPELEAEMLKRLMVKLGVQQQRAESMLAVREGEAPKARLVEAKGQVTTLVLSDSFAQAWRRTGIALDRVGFVVEDRNRSRGQYFVRYDDPNKKKKKGWLSKINPFGKGAKKQVKKYQIQLNAMEQETRVIVLDSDGQQDDSSTSKRILTLLFDQLK